MRVKPDLAMDQVVERFVRIVAAICSLFVGLIELVELYDLRFNWSRAMAGASASFHALFVQKEIVSVTVFLFAAGVFVWAIRPRRR